MAADQRLPMNGRDAFCHVRVISGRDRGRGGTRPYRSVDLCAAAAAVVAQVSKPAVSPTSKSAQCRDCIGTRRFGNRDTAGLETCDTAGLETCATGRFGKLRYRQRCEISGLAGAGGGAARGAGNASAIAMRANGTMGGIVEVGRDDGRNAFAAVVTIEPLVGVVGGDGAVEAEAGAGAVRARVDSSVKSDCFHGRAGTLTVVI